MLYEPILKDHLHKLLSAYMEATGRSETTIGRLLAKDSRFFSRVLDQNCSFTALQYDRVVCRFAREWPDGVRWPKGVPKPKPAEVREVTADET